MEQSLAQCREQFVDTRLDGGEEFLSMVRIYMDLFVCSLARLGSVGCGYDDRGGERNRSGTIRVSSPRHADKRNERVALHVACRSSCVGKQEF